MVNKPNILSDSEVLFPDRYSKDHYNALEFLKTFQVNNRSFPVPRKLYKSIYLIYISKFKVEKREIRNFYKEE